MLYQLDLGRFLQLYVIQGMILALFIYLMYRILNRSRHRINVMFFLAYLFVAIGIINNMIYGFIYISNILVILNFITNFCVAFGLIFILIFNLLIFKSEKLITRRIQNIIIFTYGVFLFLQVIFLPFNGMIINESTHWKSLWSLPYYLYVIIIISIGAVIPIVYTLFKIYIDMKDIELKRRWMYFIIGAIGLISYMYGAFTVDLFNNQMIRFVFSVISLSIVLFVIMMYYGVGRQLKD